MSDVSRVVLPLALLGLFGLAACGGDTPAIQTTSLGGVQQHRYWLVRPARVERLVPSDREQRWRRSLVRNLNHSGDVVTFVRTNIPLHIEGEARDGLVYVSTAHSDQYYVASPAPVIVDFNVGEIGTPGVGGISFHAHPAGRLVVALLPTRGMNILGVCLSDESKCGSDRFAFLEDRAEWTWEP